MKKLIRYLPTHFLLCIIIGILIQNYTSFQLPLLQFNIFLSLLFLITLLAHKFQLKVIFIYSSLLLFIGIGMSVTEINNPKSKISYFENYITDSLNNCSLKIVEKLKSNKYYHRFYANVLQVKQQQTSGRVLLYIKKDSTEKPIPLNSIILAEANFKKISSPLNPQQFNYKTYLARQRIYKQLFLTQNNFHIIATGKSTLKSIGSQIRNRIHKTLSTYFNSNELSIISALLLGERTYLSKEILDSYAKAGAIHILAVSGLHIGILIYLLNIFLSPFSYFKYGKVLKTIIILIFLWCFALITGLSSSVVRTVTMFSFMVIGQTLTQKQPIEHSLISSMLILLIINPMFLFDVGFQLSYIAVFSIIWTQPLLNNLYKPKTPLLKKAWQLITVSIAAQLGLLPLSLYYFHQFPVLFLVSNLIIIPFLGFILSSGIIIIILSLLNLLPNTVPKCYETIIYFMNRFIEWISSQESFIISQVHMEFTQMLFLYLIFFLLFQFILKKTAKHFILFCLSVISLQAILILQKNNYSSKQEFIVFHKNNASITAIRNGNLLSTYSTIDSIDIKKAYVIKSYLQKEHLTLVSTKSSRPVIRVKDNYFLFIDSLGIYPQKVKNSTVILEYSPKINLERLIKTIKPKRIIANGTNYKSYIYKWQETCKQQKTPFHYTGQNGAYIFNY